MIRTKALVLSAFVLFLTVVMAAGQNAPTADKVAVRVVSGRPDMVSDGGALIEIRGPSAIISSPRLRVLVNGRNLRQVFRNGQTADLLLGRIEGLTTGKNTLEVRDADKRQAVLELTNHPITGPVFSGPHQTPFVCQTETSGLGAPPGCKLHGENVSHLHI